MEMATTDERQGWWAFVTISFCNQITHLTAEPYWDGDEVVYPTRLGDIRLLNPYLSNVSYGELDDDSHEEVTLVGNNDEDKA